MKPTTLLLASASALLLAGCSGGDETGAADVAVAPAETAESADAASPVTPAETDGAEAVSVDVPAGTYRLDPTHAFLTATVLHMGLSHYTLNFTDFDATIDFDPENLGASQITLTIDTSGVNVNYPADYKAGHADSPYDSWPEAVSQDPRFVGGADHPEITFVSTDATATGGNSGTVTGDLTFLGVTKPVTLDVTYINGFESQWSPGQHLMGFDASTTIKRSDFGQTSLQGAISDEVAIEFSGEFAQDVDSEQTPEE